MSPNLSREEVSLAILGYRPAVRLSRDGFTVGSCEPFAAVAVTAADPDQAREYAQELAEDLERGLPAWRDWWIHYIEVLEMPDPPATGP
jgi:hypothetical protein